MIIAFKILNLQKTLAALDAANSWALDDDGWPISDPDIFWAGHLAVQAGPCLNSDQCLEVDENKGLIVYSGQRCPFIADGHLEMVIHLFEIGALGGIELYRTSDADLDWYETKARWISRSDERLIQKAAQLML